MRPPRVAYFPDSFHEVNGVAHTSRNFVSFAQRRDLPFLCVRASGSRPRQYLFETEGNLQTLELPRSRISIQMEKDLFFDPLFFRYASLIARTLRAFSPDVIHITGPSELGIFGAYFAWKLGIPLAATARFYGFAKVLFAPNAELCRMLEAATRRPCHLMQRGVDTVLFSPAHRTRPADDPTIILGFVGRLSVEKNVALLPLIARELATLTQRSVRFLIIGQGAEEQSLKAALPNADFAGVLRGQALANAYANMDLLVFPSHTDTFGNVVLEALASGVPAIVTPDGGPKYIVRDHETGYIAQDADFPQSIASLLNDPPRLARMRIAARDYAETCTWDAVFERVYAAYPHPSKP